MKEQPEALRLAQALNNRQECEDEAADELRRLYEAHDWQYKMAGERLRRIEKLEAQRDALLEALKRAEPLLIGPILLQARAAITAVEEGRTCA